MPGTNDQSVPGLSREFANWGWQADYTKGFNGGLIVVFRKRMHVEQSPEANERGI
jgi:hypothetical protein